jgi:hypothetical protein
MEILLLLCLHCFLPSHNSQLTHCFAYPLYVALFWTTQKTPVSSSSYIVACLFLPSNGSLVWWHKSMFTVPLPISEWCLLLCYSVMLQYDPWVWWWGCWCYVTGCSVPSCCCSPLQPMYPYSVPSSYLCTPHVFMTFPSCYHGTSSSFRGLGYCSLVFYWIFLFLGESQGADQLVCRFPPSL